MKASGGKKALPRFRMCPYTPPLQIQARLGRLVPMLGVPVRGWPACLPPPLYFPLPFMCPLLLPLSVSFPLMHSLLFASHLEKEFESHKCGRYLLSRSPISIITMTIHLRQANEHSCPLSFQALLPPTYPHPCPSFSVVLSYSWQTAHRT